MSQHTKDVTISECEKQLKSVPPPLPKLPPPSIHRRHRNFRALSANVQRLISHSNTSLHPDDMNENHSTTGDDTNLNSVRKRLLSSQIQLSTPNGCKFKHPLSKNTCKLTQSGNDLVIDGDSDGGYVTPPEIPYANLHDDNLYDLVNSNVSNDDESEDVVDKTPINEYQEFDFATTTIEDHINCNVDDDVYDEVEKIEEPKCDWTSNENSNGKNGVDDDDDEDSGTVAALCSLKNTSFIHSFTQKNEHVANGNDSTSQSDSIQNSPTLSQKSNNSDNSETKSRKSQLFAIKAQVIEQSTKNHSTINNSSMDNDILPPVINVENGVDDTVPSLSNETIPTTVPATTTIITESTATTVTATPTTNTTKTSTTNHKENGQLTIDLKRTKIRPLSSVSISSTSSSSSSASDEHSTIQNPISYLASVESLADHSENELAINSASLTVTERACLEIIDSERSYVDDLGQVIRG